MSRLGFRAWLALLSLLISCTAALTNSVAVIDLAPRKPASEDAATLVRQSSNIVLADVQSLIVHGRAREYRTKVVETLKGTIRGTVVIRMPFDEFSSATNEEADFDRRGTQEGYGHLDIAFWLGAAGRPVPLDAAGFGKGRYLFFLDGLHHRYGAEPIVDGNDPWHLAVKTMIANSALRGSPVEPVAFLKMFGSIYLAKCGTPQPPKYELSKIWGEDYKLDGWRATLRDDHPPDFLDPDFEGRREPCTVRKGQSFYYLALFVDNYTQFPIAVPAENGVVQFDQRYGNIALTSQDVPLDTLIRELRR